MATGARRENHHGPSRRHTTTRRSTARAYTGERLINNPKDEWFEFTGKSAGRVKVSSPNSEEKCAEYALLFESMKKEAQSFIDTNATISE